MQQLNNSMQSKIYEIRANSSISQSQIFSICENEDKDSNVEDLSSIYEFSVDIGGVSSLDAFQCLNETAKADVEEEKTEIRCE